MFFKGPKVFDWTGARFGKGLFEIFLLLRLQGRGTGLPGARRTGQDACPTEERGKHDPSHGYWGLGARIISAISAARARAVCM